MKDLDHETKAPSMEGLRRAEGRVVLPADIQGERPSIIPPL